MIARFHKGFTLIELMVVVGIIGLLMLIAIPAFQGADRGGRIRSAIFQLNSTLSLARQTAISNRDYVYVVFPHDDDSIYESEPSFVQNALRSYAVYSRRDGYIGEWRVLPPGVLFHPTQGDADRNIFGRANCVMNIPFPSGTNSNREVIVAGFRADGPFHAGGIDPADIFMTEGATTYDMSLGTISETLFRTDVMMQVEINPITGQSRIREL